MGSMGSVGSKGWGPSSVFPSFLWKEVPRRGGGWLGAFLSLGQPLALRAFPFQRKGIDEARFLLSNFRVSPVVVLPL